MRLDSIELNNYRQYKGNVFIKFKDNARKNFNVLQGVNGAGKTNLMNAINWCLYGVEENLEKYSGERQPILNDSIYNNMENGDIKNVRVKLTFIDEENRNYVFERFFNVLKRDDKYIYEGADKLHAYVQVNRDMVEIEYSNILLNRILPFEIKNFFFFDGERLDEFFTKENTYKIRDAIFDVSQLTILENSIDHLENTIKKLRSQIKDEVNPRIKELKLGIEQVEKGKDFVKNKKNNDEEELKNVRLELEKINMELRESNELLIKELQKRRDSLNQSHNNIINSLQNRKNNLLSNIINIGPSIFALNSIYKTKKILDDKTEKGEIPPKIRDTFIRELLESGKCICGTDVSKQNDNRIMLENLLNKVILSQISGELTELKYEVNELYKNTNNFITIQDKLRREINKYLKEERRIKDELEDISIKLKQYGDIDVTQLEIRRRELKQKEDKLIGDISIANSQINNAKNKIEQFGRELQKELTKDMKNLEIKDKLKISNDTLHLFYSVKNNLISNIRKNVEEKTKQYFLDIIWKKGVYVDVKIAEDYTISVINNEGSQCLGSLSAGERQVLALSFLAALRDISGFDAPVLIDTPLGRISKEPKENIAKLLPKFLEGVQVTMLMTDEEYTDTVRNRLLNNIATEYELEFLETTAQTMVVPYGRS